MSETDFLLWVRGPALLGATIIFVLGIVVRLLEILLVGSKPNLAEARGSAVKGGLRTIVMRSIAERETLQRTAFTEVTGWIFHLGFLITLFFYTPHILLFDQVFGVTWPALPTPVIDALSIVTIVTLLAVLIHRITNPVMRFLSRFQDYLVWFVTILPVLTGYIAFHRVGLTPPMLIAIHILSVELLMVVFPFTKLMHAFTLFMSRYYNGAIAGYKGVNS